MRATVEKAVSNELTYIVVRSNAPGVDVPLSYRYDPYLVLKISWLFRDHDMRLDEDALRVAKVKLAPTATPFGSTLATIRASFTASGAK